MSGRFPGASTIEQFWQNLRNGVESILPLSDEDLANAGVARSLAQAPNFVRAAAVLKESDRFDASFFGYSPREADVLDPQQRLFLECAWEAIEGAGYDPVACPGAVGVFAGMSPSAYLEQLLSHAETHPVASPFQLAISTDKDYLTTRVAYKLNLKGPSITVQTACSTSLVAVVLACQSLLNFQCDMALAGGASVQLPQQAGYLYEEDGILSPDGHCRAFDAAAQGTVFGSGVGVVLCKRMDDALADGDNILAVIKGWAVNNDGASKVGYTAPSVEGQAAVVAMAQAVADVHPETITYVEAHGTATALGDPLEVAALRQVFSASTDRTAFCAIGSVKTNVGHLDAAAGVAGLIKSVLALQHKELPPSLHFREPNPRLDLARSPFYVNSQLTAWPAGATPRRAGVSSFGIGGTNAHIVLEEAPPVAASDAAKAASLLTLSAKTPTALAAASANLLEYLRQRPGCNLADVAYTLQVGRTQFAHRRVLACRTAGEAVSALETLDPARVFTASREASERPIVFMFPGQGAQYPGMTQGIYDAEPVFREQVDRCADLLHHEIGFDLRRLLYPDADRLAEAGRELEQTAVAQPALFVVEYALARLWMEWGVRPRAMIGHSSGEYPAACLAGVLSLEDALHVVATRGRLMQRLPQGAMLAVPLAEEALAPLLGRDLALAAVNGPTLCVVAGPTTAVDELAARLAARGIEGVRLHTSHAFHSPAMDPVVAPFVACVSGISRHSPQIPYISNVTGAWMDDAAITPSYWGDHLRQTVRFASGLEEVLQLPNAVMLEVGPGHTLGRLAAQHPARTPHHEVLASVRSARDSQSDIVRLLTTLGRVWTAGVPADWSHFSAHQRRRRIALPTYPFERQRHWIEPYRPTAVAPQPLASRKGDIGDWFSMPSWQQTMAPQLPKEALSSSSNWLVLADRRGLGRALVDGLRKAGRQVTVVVEAERFAQLDSDLFSLAPGSSEHYASLLRALRAQGRLPETVLHCWGVTGDDQTGISEDGLPSLLAANFYSLLHLAQALADVQVFTPIQIGIVSDGLFAITGDEALNPAKATALGPSQVIPLEYPNIACRSVDVVLPPAGPASLDRLRDQLLAEFLAPAAGAAVAYRGPHRWTRTFQPVQFPPAGARSTTLREGGVYLITGGLGGMGLVLAEGLARACRARLVLAGRSPFPDRERWDGWLLDHPDEDLICRRIHKVRELEAQGAEVLVASVDVADQRQVSDLVERIGQQFGPLSGVIHAAGVAGGGVIQLKTAEAAAAVLAPKVQGLLAVVTALAGVPLDFFVLCSSVNAVLGGPGQVDYCAANAFLDAFAHYSTITKGRPVLSINWDTWSEVGMAVVGAMPGRLATLRAESLEHGIRSQEGSAVLTRLLGAPLPQVVVSPRDLRTRMAGSVSTGVQRAIQELERRPTGRHSHDRPPLAATFVPPSGEIEQRIAAVWQELLGIEQVGRHDDFFDLGGHSLLAIQVNAQLRSALQAELSIQAIFDAPTVAELAGYVERSQAKAMEDNGRVLQMLDLVERLSDDALQSLLNEPA